MTKVIVWFLALLMTTGAVWGWLVMRAVLGVWAWPWLLLAAIPPVFALVYLQSR